MESLPVRRIHIDSREKTDNSDSHSDFHIRLSQSVSLPDDSICMVDNISIPNTFFTVETDRNDSLYIAEKLSAANVVCRKVTLDQNYYSASQFAFELALKLNVGTPAVMGVDESAPPEKLLLHATRAVDMTRRLILGHAIAPEAPAVDRPVRLLGPAG